jgi:hypothetical protein
MGHIICWSMLLMMMNLLGDTMGTIKEKPITVAAWAKV